MAAPGRGAAADVCTSLALLAAKFEGEGQPLPAIHALYALLQQRTHLLPDQEAVARCTLGRLLLEHTTNLKEARQELMAAVRGRCVGAHGRAWACARPRMCACVQ